MDCRCPTVLEPQGGQGRFLSKLAEVGRSWIPRDLPFLDPFSYISPWVLPLRMLKHIVHQSPAYVREETRASL